MSQSSDHRRLLINVPLFNSFWARLAPLHPLLSVLFFLYVGWCIILATDRKVQGAGLKLGGFWKEMSLGQRWDWPLFPPVFILLALCLEMTQTHTLCCLNRKKADFRGCVILKPVRFCWAQRAVYSWRSINWCNWISEHEQSDNIALGRRTVPLRSSAVSSI